MKKFIIPFLVSILIFGLIPISMAEDNYAPNWDISGNWEVDLQGYEREFVNLEQDENGIVSGEFRYLSNSIWEYGGTLDGYVNGDEVYLHYERPEIYDYTGEFSGLIALEEMHGEFIDSNDNTYSWVAIGHPKPLVWDARISGGGQLLAETGEFKNNGKPIYYKISFGGGSYIVNNEFYFDGLEVTFHNVSDESVNGGKFIGEEVYEMNFNFNEGVANYKVRGTFNGDSGYWMMIRVQDSGEPNFNADNLRFELHGSESYDSFNSGDFPGESITNGTARNSLERGNIQVDNGDFNTYTE